MKKDNYITFTVTSQETVALSEIAGAKYEGNKSFAIRQLIKKEHENLKKKGIIQSENLNK